MTAPRKITFFALGDKKHPRGQNEMKFAAAVIFVFGIVILVCAQQPQPKRAAGAPSIGLAVGSKVPAFELLDQNGRKHSNETLKGANGTILLFFRSADW